MCDRQISHEDIKLLMAQGCQFWSDKSFATWVVSKHIPHAMSLAGAVDAYRKRINENNGGQGKANT